MFDNIKPVDPKWERRKKQIWIAIIVFIVVAPILFYEFKNWPEEQVAKSFLTALQNGQYQEAYGIWKPASSYTMDSFMRDWGKDGDVGKVASFQITHSHAVGSGVIITARINDSKEARIWVEKKDKSLGFPPY